MTIQVSYDLVWATTGGTGRVFKKGTWAPGLDPGPEHTDIMQ